MFIILAKLQWLWGVGCPRRKAAELRGAFRPAHPTVHSPQSTAELFQCVQCVKCLGYGDVPCILRDYIIAGEAKLLNLISTHCECSAVWHIAVIAVADAAKQWIFQFGIFAQAQ